MIYLLEDDESIRNFVCYALNNSGYESKGFERPSEFWAAMEEEIPSLLLLDIMLPEENGIDILKKLRDKPKTANMPVIMLTAKSTEYDKVIGLDSGADDYMVEQLDIEELGSLSYQFGESVVRITWCSVARRVVVHKYESRR